MLDVNDISVRYETRDVLRGVSLRLKAGEMLAVLGPNGAGKTTLIKTLNGMIMPSSGEVLLNGKKLGEYSRREVAGEVSVVAQENETRFPMTVLEFVLAGRFAGGTTFGWETEDDIARAKAALAECDLAEMTGRLMNELSGGERQRVVLARAFTAGSKILLLDEPTANLDPAHQAAMLRAVRAKCDNDGHSAVVITHDLNLAAAFADSIVLIKNGQIFAAGTPREVLTEANIAEVFGIKVLLDENPVTKQAHIIALY